jgi:hypothetical protein
MRLKKLAQSFWLRVEKGQPDKCWEWQGYRTWNGYGLLQSRSISPQPLLAHRIAWELINGEIPAGRHILHHCDNPSCCNPSHLFIGTQRDNNKDRDQKKRTASGDRNGARTHPEKNSFIINKGSGLKGVAHPMAKLSEQEIRAIIEAYPSAPVKTHLADQYGISLTHLQRLAKKFNIYT